MQLSADRLSGVFFLLFGLAMYFLVIPNYVEITDEGNLAPNTLPNWISIIITLCGAALILKPTQLLKPTQHETQNLQAFLITGAYVAILVAGIYAMSLFGFVYIAPVLALAIMVMIGERRPLWLIAGAVAMPAIIWFFVIHVLGRVLP